MVLAVIEAVYRFLWGDLFTIPIGQRKWDRNPSSRVAFDPNGDLFYDPDEIPSGPAVSGYDPGAGRKKEGRRRSVTGAGPCLCRQRPVWEWGISSELSLRSLRAVREPCSGCGSRRSLVPPRHLWRQPWRIYTKKKIRSTADITAVRLIISTAMRSA